MSNTKEGKVESCSKIKEGNGRFAQGEDEVRRIWKEYFEDLCNIDTQEKVAVHKCGLNGIQRGNYFGEGPIGRAKVEMRVGKLKNGKTVGKDEIRNNKKWR